MSLPFVSVVIPIRNEEAFIARCLEAVLIQDYPPEQLEILVADGMSTDRTRAIIAGLEDAARITVIDNTGLIQAAGLNAALQRARGEIVVRVDGHTVIAPDYVRECVAALAETGAHNVGGAMDPAGVTPTGRAIAAAGKSAFAVPTAFHVARQAQYTDTVYLGAWPRRVFEEVGLFNPAVNVNEDYELNYRIRQAGGRVYFTPRIRSTYYGRQTLRALARQYFRYGRTKVRMLRLHPGSLRPRQMVAPTFVAGLIGGLLLGMAFPPVLAAWGLMLGAYAAASLIASLQAFRRAPGVDLWRLPVIFFTIHGAWGLGFWWEIVARAFSRAAGRFLPGSKTML
jgi:succinoglycan biosynthesis protein ExoA